MKTKILDGKALAALKFQGIKEQVDTLQAKKSKKPRLAVVLVGDDPASQTYVNSKEVACQNAGIESETHRLDKNCTQAELDDLVEKLNNDQGVHAVLVQFPLPDHLDKEKVLKKLSPKKDVDGLTSENIGLLFSGKPRVVPCTPLGIQEILKHYDIPVSGKNVAVLGRSQLVGLSVAQLMQMMNGTVTVCHSKTKDIPSITQNSDIVIAAAGVPELLGKEDFKEGAVVIDVGIHRKGKNEKTGKFQLCGDVRSDETDGWVSAITPVPGGVGPMTIAMLLENTLRLFKSQE